MPYNAVYERDAQGRFEQLDPVLASMVYEAIEVLCHNPTQLSRTSVFPYPQHYQLFETDLEHDGERILLKVFFHYGQDEQSLLIDDFVLVRLR